MKVVVVGVGVVGCLVICEFVENGYDIILIECNFDYFDVVVILEVYWWFGDVCELSLLELIYFEEFDVVVVVIGDDKVNVVFSLLVKIEFVVLWVVVWVNDFCNEWLFNDVWGVDVVVFIFCMLVLLIEEVVMIGDLVWLMEFCMG